MAWDHLEKDEKENLINELKKAPLEHLKLFVELSNTPKAIPALIKKKDFLLKFL